jgi:hypothetical protein
VPAKDDAVLVHLPIHASWLTWIHFSILQPKVVKHANLAHPAALERTPRLLLEPSPRTSVGEDR